MCDCIWMNIHAHVETRTGHSGPLELPHKPNNLGSDPHVKSQRNLRTPLLGDVRQIGGSSGNDALAS